MAEVPTWLLGDGRWSTITINGRRFGPPDFVSSVKEAKLELRVDDKQSRGKDRGSVVFGGMRTPRFSVSMVTHTQAGEETLRAALATDLFPQKDPSRRRYLKVEHPSLLACRITAGAVASYSESLGKDGLLVVNLDFVAADGNAQKKKTTNKPKGATGSGGAEVPAEDLSPGAPPTRDRRDILGKPSKAVKT